jgi:hypothetical protein
VTAIPAELFLVVLFFDLRRLHGLRERQRQRIAVVRARLPRFCISAFDSSTNRLLRLM